MEHAPVCPNCESLLDLAVKNPIQSLVYRHVPCPNCGTICMLEGPEADVAYSIAVVGENRDDTLPRAHPVPSRRHRAAGPEPGN